MEIEKICCQNKRDEKRWNFYEGRLLAFLKGTVFYLTSQSAFQLIKNSGEIQHNKDGCFKLNAASGKSFGRLKGWVCFFDFRNATLETIKDTCNSYNFLLPPGAFRKKPRENWAEYSLAYLILDSRYYDSLLPYEKFNEHVKNTGEHLTAIRKVETWIDNRVPIGWIGKVILADIGEAVTDHEILVFQVHRELPLKSESK